jgi:cyclase
VRRVSRNVFTEVYYWGCNPSFLATSDGVVMFDTPQQPKDAVAWREKMLEHGPIRYLFNTEPHGDHIMGNAYFPGVEVITQEGIRSRYDEQVPAMTSPERVERMKEQDPDSVWLLNHPDYPPNPPTRTFTDGLTLELGNHTVRAIHMPGHTKPQTSFYIPEENVVITGDNVFSGCKTFIQEGDPIEWLAALEDIRNLDAALIVPGHGEVTDNAYLATQRQVLENWIGVVERFLQAGMTEDEALAQPLDVPSLDPYPIGQRLFALSEALNGRNVRNIYQKLQQRQSPAVATT